ncbi:hypothetical protein HT585_02145 [Ensifer sp. HO-A22]|uniref:Uncharacterized protein n=1 Tax=Ensifer oleiphilus TaxID=2742698 RepID=A0A7Y6Q213_9HYPH|nr:hypothetical protein [Ensifer oleiphilus]NVD37642.1 hypothetical protein [Ensifer oleiphilus]
MLEFPEQPELETVSSYLRSGVALHELADVAPGVEPDQKSNGISARQLKIFASDEFLSECMRVLEAHGWMKPDFRLTDTLLDQLIEALGSETLSDAHARYGENWDAYLLEIAAVRFARPFSRRWYAANMYSLYYAHQDDFRLGYLWSEYQAKMRHESSALKHEQFVQKNRESGKKGGQGWKKAERYAVLDRLADAEFTKLRYPGDKELRKCAQRLARQHDAKVEDKLFVQNGIDLSLKWFDEWLADYRTRKRLETQTVK